MVEDIAISRIFRSEMPADQKVDQLVELALSGGGKDNITVVFIDIKGGP
jgi:serine/threonine protein phosphatase PrpC